MRLSLALYLGFVSLMVGGFVLWAVLTDDTNERIVAWATVGSQSWVGSAYSSTPAVGVEAGITCGFSLFYRV